MNFKTLRFSLFMAIPIIAMESQKTQGTAEAAFEQIKNDAQESYLKFLPAELRHELFQFYNDVSALPKLIYEVSTSRLFVFDKFILIGKIFDRPEYLHLRNKPEILESILSSIRGLNGTIFDHALELHSQLIDQWLKHKIQIQGDALACWIINVRLLRYSQFCYANDENAEIRRLLDLGANPGVRGDNDLWFPLMHVLKAGNYHAVKILIDAGAKVTIAVIKVAQEARAPKEIMTLLKNEYEKQSNKTNESKKMRVI